MGFKEREEVQAKGISNVFNKIIAENFPNLKKEFSIQVQEASRTLSRHNKIEHLRIILSLKQPAQEQRKHIEDCEKNQII
jgi:hypothetical protein